MKIIFYLTISLVVTVAFADLSAASPQLGKIVKDKNGEIRRFVQSSDWWKDSPPWYKEFKGKGAVEYCANSGMHLPSIRELVQLASRKCTPDIKGKEPCGAVGIAELTDDTYITEDYILVEVNKYPGEGVKDRFYYNPVGYIAPADGYGTIWSSSNSSPSTHTGFTFDDRFGTIRDFVFRGTDAAVRCARGR